MLAKMVTLLQSPTSCHHISVLWMAGPCGRCLVHHFVILRTLILTLCVMKCWNLVSRCIRLVCGHMQLQFYY